MFKSLTYAIILSSKLNESKKINYLVCHGYTCIIMYFKNLNYHMGGLP